MLDVKDTMPPENLEDFEKNYTPVGGLASILDYYTAETDEEKEAREKAGGESSKEGKKKDDTDKDTTPPPPADEDIDEEFKGKPVKEIVTQLKELRTSADTYKAKVEEFEKNPPVADVKLKEFIDNLKTDPFKAWEKFQKDFELPNLSLFKSIVDTGGDAKIRLKHFQDNELRSKIEEKFNLDKGTFKFDADEAENPDTPSYEFRRASRLKEQEIEGEVGRAMQRVKDGEKLARERQAEDKKWYAETFLGGDLKKADEAVKALSDIPAKILKGELPPHKHPFSTRTLLLGINHDTLLNQALDKQKTEIMEAFAKQGFKLRSDELPESLKHINKSQTGEGEETRKVTVTGIPALDALNKYAN